MPLPRVHAITDDRVVSLPNLATIARAIALGPDVALHARARDDDVARDVTEMFLTLREETGVRVIVNNRPGLARTLGADGFHLPASAPAPPRSDGLLIGRSAHSAPAARSATDMDWIMLGPIWRTASHPDRAPLGLESLRDIPAHTIAVGGVTPARARAARAAGAFGVAAIGALWDAPDPGAAVRALLLSFQA